MVIVSKAVAVVPKIMGLVTVRGRQHSEPPSLLVEAAIAIPIKTPKIPPYTIIVPWRQMTARDYASVGQSVFSQCWTNHQAGENRNGREIYSRWKKFLVVSDEMKKRVELVEEVTRSH